MTDNQTENQNVTAADEVVDICRDLIRIDTTNPGDHSGPGERLAAEHVAALLGEVGIEATILESHPKRASVVARIAGEDSSRPALMMHGHLDVVPANAADWQVDPFSGEIKDGCVWGRGAVDMKDMDAMILAVVRQRMREGRRPPRDVALVFTADEEAGSTWGARFLAEKHPEVFEGVTEAIGEVGGYSVTIGGRRLYLMQTAERGIAWMRLKAQGTAGHGAMVHPDNAVTELAEAVGRLGRHEWPIRLIGELVGAHAINLPSIPGPFADDAWGRLFWVIAAIYVSCTALRLARFNVINKHDVSSHMNFRGMPSPGAAFMRSSALGIRNITGFGSAIALSRRP